MEEQQEQQQQEQEQVNKYGDFEDYDHKYQQKTVKISLKETVSSMGIQTQYYYVQTFEDNEQKHEVERRFKDFEWLFNQLSFVYFGHQIPPIPPKDAQAKIKIPIYSNDTDKNSENNLVQFRIQIFQIFLNLILKDKLLSQSVDVNMFLTEQSNQIFETHKDNSEYIKDYNSQGSYLYTGVKNLIDIAYYFTNKQQDQKNINFPPIQTKEEIEQFSTLQKFYEGQKEKFDSIFNCFNHIFEYKQSQYKNLSEVSNIFKELDDIKERNQNDDADEEQKEEEQEEFNDIHDDDNKENKKLPALIKEASGYLIYLDKCLDSLKERQALIEKIQQKQQELMQKEEDNTKKQYQIMIDRLKKFNENFLKNKDNFDQNLNDNIQQIILKLSQNQEEFSKQMLEIWAREVQYK